MPLRQRDAVLTLLDTLSERYLQGKARSLKLAVITLLARGHLLLEDIPGLGKTTLALALARSLGLSFGRVQCTSDLLPSDITGLSIFDREKGEFRFVPGPIFNNILLVDEINRATPRTQSALLEAMEEKRVTVEGTTYPLPEPFLVIATQNPVEQVGTFPLPESQLDRFMVSTGIGYPPAEVEQAIIRGGSIRDDILAIKPQLTVAALAEAQQSVLNDIYLGDKVVGYIHALMEASRVHPMVLSGISTRGGITLAEAAKAHAYLDNRDHVIPEDLQAVAVATGAHRLVLRPEHEGVAKKGVLTSLLDALPVPQV
ncbi:MAG: AAA family ATPase [Desulfuromonas sp.]|nr:MAG: AAA family ATPase [Desulfuromonas sp.]